MSISLARGSFRDSSAERAGRTYAATYGDTVVTRTGAENAVTSLHPLRVENGEVRDRKPEGLPEGWNLSVGEGDARSGAVHGIKWEGTTMSQGWWVVDLAAGSVKALSPHGESVSFDRDTAGKLWRYASTGAGTYGGRVLIGTGGWNGFKGLF